MFTCLSSNNVFAKYMFFDVCLISMLRDQQNYCHFIAYAKTKLYQTTNCHARVLGTDHTELEQVDSELCSLRCCDVPK